MGIVSIFDQFPLEINEDTFCFFVFSERQDTEPSSMAESEDKWEGARGACGVQSTLMFRRVLPHPRHQQNLRNLNNSRNGSQDESENLDEDEEDEEEDDEEEEEEETHQDQSLGGLMRLHAIHRALRATLRAATSAAAATYLWSARHPDFQPENSLHNLSTLCKLRVQGWH